MGSRKELGLPLEEPGRYADKEFWGKNPYDPRDPRWRHDYWGDPSKLKDELRRDREPRTPRVDEAAVVEEDEDDLLGAFFNMISVHVASLHPKFVYTEPEFLFLRSRMSCRQVVSLHIILCVLCVIGYCCLPFSYWLGLLNWATEGKEEEKEELVGGDTTTHMKTANEDRGVVNGTATIHMDDVRGMFTMQPEVSIFKAHANTTFSIHKIFLDTEV